jgi:polysaccharide chain length determinant protein (PEP-CTERM system associated)
MVRNGDITLADVSRIFRRYWWVLPLTTLFAGAVGLTAALVLPKKYTSETVILVEQPTVSSKYVEPVITENLNQRLTSMQEQILSRSRLQPIIENFGLYQSERGRVHIEDLVARLRTAINIRAMEPTPGTQRGQAPGFFVDVTFDDPQLAQRICTQITSMFLEENARDREQKASQTTSFLTGQLDEAKAKLDEQDAKLAEFKREHAGTMPENEQSNLNFLEGMNTQLEANTQALSRAQQDKTFNESLLGQQEMNWKASQTGQNPETAEQQLTLLQDQLAALQSKYTDEHPDIVKLKSQIRDLKKRSAQGAKDSTAATTSVSTMEPPQMQQLRAKIRQDNQNIADLTKRQGQIQAQIGALQGRVQASPLVEQQLKELTRNYTTALEFYNSLLKSRDTAAMASDLEHRQESEQFKVLDAASLPLTPSSPKKPVLIGGGLGAGLALGLGILYLLALNDRAIYSERDVETCLKLPVLTHVPSLELLFHEASMNEKPPVLTSSITH